MEFVSVQPRLSVASSVQCDVSNRALREAVESGMAGCMLGFIVRGNSPFYSCVWLIRGFGGNSLGRASRRAAGSPHRLVLVVGLFHCPHSPQEAKSGLIDWCIGYDRMMTYRGRWVSMLARHVSSSSVGCSAGHVDGSSRACARRCEFWPSRVCAIAAATQEQRDVDCSLYGAVAAGERRADSGPHWP